MVPLLTSRESNTKCSTLGHMALMLRSGLTVLAALDAIVARDATLPEDARILEPA